MVAVTVFQISNNRTQIVNVPARIPNCNCHSPALLDFFLSSGNIIFLQWLSLHSEILIMLFQFPLTFHQVHLAIPLSSHSLWLFSCWLEWSSWSFEGCSMGDIFRFDVSVAASELYEWVQVGIDVYIPHCKYQVNPHSSPWFSSASAVVIVHRNHFFCLDQQNKSSESNVGFSQVSN